MRSLRFIGFALAVGIPLALLFDPRTNFYFDWGINQWYVGYFGEFIRQHHHAPEVMNSPLVIGLPQPIFYGCWFFPVAGLISAFTGAAIAMRAILILTTVIQFIGVYAAAIRMMAHRGFSFVLAAAITWGVYPLTNLYNRAALTEYVGVALLTAGVSFGIAAAVEPRQGLPAAILIWAAGACAAFAFGTHPPTALVGSVFLLGLILLALVCGWRTQAREKSFVLAAAITAGLAAAMLAPWACANLRMDHSLYILGRLHRFVPNGERTNHYLMRLTPFPYDGGSLLHGTEVSTPYVEGQVDWSLILILAANLYLLRGTYSRRTDPAPETPLNPFAVGLTALGCLWLAVALSFSIWEPLVNLLAFLASYIQFPTRFISFANLGALVAILGAGQLVASRQGYRQMDFGSGIIMGAALAVALLGMLIKLTHATSVMSYGTLPQYAWSGDRSALMSFDQPGAIGDYTTSSLYPALAPSDAAAAKPALFPVGDRGPRFGVPADAVVDLAKDGWVTTNLAAFKWSQISIDGHEPAAGTIAVFNARMALRLPAGPHRLHWTWRPDSAWSWLRSAARWCFLLMLALPAVLWLWLRKLRAAFATQIRPLVARADA